MSSSESRIRYACSLAGACVIGLSLSALPDALTQPAKEKAGESAISVEGCLTKEGPAGRSTAAEQFVLVLPVQDKTTGARPTGGVAGSPPLPKMYALRSNDKAPVELATFVNQRVKVEGTTTAAATSAPLAGRSPEATPYPAPVATGGTTSEPTGTPFDRANLPTIVVTSMTSIAKSCQ